MGFTDRIKDRLNHWGMIAGAIVVAFLIGFVPTWLKAESNAAERDVSRAQLRKAETINLLSSAIVDARRGEYETARQETSEFFSRLNAEEDKGIDGFLTEDQRNKTKAMLTDRDDVITTLAQRDPASIDRLTGLFDIYRQTLSDVRQDSKQ